MSLQKLDDSITLISIFLIIMSLLNYNTSLIKDCIKLFH